MKPTKEQLYVALGYLVFMGLFYFWGITGAQFDSFIAIVLLSLVYAGGVWFVKKIISKVRTKKV